MTTYVYPTNARNTTKPSMTRNAIPAECRHRKSLIPERERIEVRVPTNDGNRRLLTRMRGETEAVSEQPRVSDFQEQRPVCALEIDAVVAERAVRVAEVENGLRIDLV